MTHWMITAGLIGLLALSPAAFAQDALDSLTPDQRREKIKAMSPEERRQFMQDRKAQWEAMSDAEKVEIIEKRRAERIKHMDERWENMSDQEKIEHVERRMQKKAERWKQRRGETE